METLIWRHLALQHPPDWEMLQFAREPESGRCLLADRYQYRLEFTWRQCKRPPDWNRTLRDYQSKLAKDHPGATIHEIESSGWTGLQVQAEELSTTRFGHFFPREGCLVEIVFIGDSPGDEKMIGRVLSSVHEQPATGGTARWRAFGMDVRCSDSVDLKACRVEPARAKMEFGPKKRPGPTETFQRLGLAPHWLKVPVRDWLRSQAPGNLVDRAELQLHLRGHEIAGLEGRLNQGRLLSFMGHSAPYRSAAWICPADGRLYCVSHAGHKGDDTVPLAGNRLACCEAVATEARGR